MKGRDPGAQVSSLLPGQGGVGAGTSGLGKCPFGDVRSLSAAPPVPPPLALRVPAGTRPRRPTYTQVRRTCPLAPAGSRLRFLAQPLPRTASHTAASGRQPRVLWRLPAPRTAPLRPLHLLFGKGRGEHQKETPGLRRSPLLTSSSPVVTCSLYCETFAPPEGRFVFTSGDQIFAVTRSNFF